MENSETDIYEDIDAAASDLDNEDDESEDERQQETDLFDQIYSFETQREVKQASIIDDLRRELEEAKRTVKDTLAANAILKANMESLLLTARKEIGRKVAELAELQKAHIRLQTRSMQAGGSGHGTRPAPQARPAVARPSAATAAATGSLGLVEEAKPAAVTAEQAVRAAEPAEHRALGLTKASTANHGRDNGVVRPASVTAAARHRVREVKDEPATVARADCNDDSLARESRLRVGSDSSHFSAPKNRGPPGSASLEQQAASPVLPSGMASSPPADIADGSCAHLLRAGHTNAVSCEDRESRSGSRPGSHSEVEGTDRRRDPFNNFQRHQRSPTAIKPMANERDGRTTSAENGRGGGGTVTFDTASRRGDHSTQQLQTAHHNGSASNEQRGGEETYQRAASLGDTNGAEGFCRRSGLVGSTNGRRESVDGSERRGSSRVDNSPVRDESTRRGQTRLSANISRDSAKREQLRATEIRHSSPSCHLPVALCRDEHAKSVDNRDCMPATQRQFNQRHSHDAFQRSTDDRSDGRMLVGSNSRDLVGQRRVKLDAAFRGEANERPLSEFRTLKSRGGSRGHLEARVDESALRWDASMSSRREMHCDYQRRMPSLNANKHQSDEMMSSRRRPFDDYPASESVKRQRSPVTSTSRGDVVSSFADRSTIPNARGSRGSSLAQEGNTHLPVGSQLPQPIDEHFRGDSRNKTTKRKKPNPDTFLSSKRQQMRAEAEDGEVLSDDELATDSHSSRNVRRKT